MHVKEPRTFIVEEYGFTPVFVVHTASTLVYRFPEASELQCLSVLLRHPWFHYQKCIIIIIIIIVIYRDNIGKNFGKNAFTSMPTLFVNQDKHT